MTDATENETIRHEKVMAEISRMIAETGKISAETGKIIAETGKINSENRWYPMIITASAAASATLGIVAIAKLFL